MEKTGTELMMQTYARTRAHAEAHRQGIRDPQAVRAFIAGVMWAAEEVGRAFKLTPRDELDAELVAAILGHEKF